jgi:hypothetical protein
MGPRKKVKRAQPRLAIRANDCLSNPPITKRNHAFRRRAANAFEQSQLSLDATGELRRAVISYRQGRFMRMRTSYGDAACQHLSRGSTAATPVVASHGHRSCKVEHGLVRSSYRQVYGCAACLAPGLQELR